MKRGESMHNVKQVFSGPKYVCRSVFYNISLYKQYIKKFHNQNLINNSLEQIIFKVSNFRQSKEVKLAFNFEPVFMCQSIKSN